MLLCACLRLLSSLDGQLHLAELVMEIVLLAVLQLLLACLRLLSTCAGQLPMAALHPAALAMDIVLLVGLAAVA